MRGETVLDDRMKDGRRLVQGVVESAMQAAHADGLGRRSILLGLWQTSVSAVLAVAEPDVAANLFVDRASVVRGQGSNADAPSVSMDAATAARHREQSSRAASVIAARVDGASGRLADMAIEEDVPEILLDVAIGYLSDAWGPAHLRRALAAQVEALSAGQAGPVMPPEPSAWNSPSPQRSVVPGRPARRLPAGAVLAPAARPPAPIHAPEPPPPPPVDEAAESEADDAPPPPSLDDMEDDVAPFSMSDDGFDTIRPSDDDPDPVLEGSAHGAGPAAAAPDEDPLSGFADALDALDGDVPVPPMAEVPDRSEERASPVVEVGEEDDFPSPAPAAEVRPEPSSRRPASEPASAEDLLAILDVPLPEEEAAAPADMDDMPVPPPASAARPRTSWHEAAARETEGGGPSEEDATAPGWSFEGAGEDDDTDEPMPEATADEEAERQTPRTEEHGELAPSSAASDASHREAGHALPADEAPAVGVAPVGLAAVEADEEAPVADVHVPKAPVPRLGAPVEKPVAVVEGVVEKPAAVVEAPVAPGPVASARPAPPEPLYAGRATVVPAGAVEVPDGRDQGFGAVGLRHSPKDRYVECMIVVEAAEGGGASAYACLTDVAAADGSLRERREVVGTVAAVGRRASLAVAARVVASLGTPSGEETLRLVVDADMLLAGMAPPSMRPPRARPEAEAEAWEDLDVLCAARTVQWVRRKAGIANATAERCDRLVRNLLETLN